MGNKTILLAVDNSKVSWGFVERGNELHIGLRHCVLFVSSYKCISRSNDFPEHTLRCRNVLRPSTSCLNTFRRVTPVLMKVELTTLSAEYSVSILMPIIVSRVLVPPASRPSQLRRV